MIPPVKQSQVDPDLRKFAFVVEELQRICMKDCCKNCQRWTQEFVEILKEGDLEQINNYVSEDFNEPECQLSTTPGQVCVDESIDEDFK